MKKRAARIEVEGRKASESSGRENRYYQDYHLEDLQSPFHFVRAKEAVAQEPEQAPEQRIDQTARERTNDQARSSMSFQFRVAQKCIPGPSQRRTKQNGSQRFEPRLRWPGAANHEGNKQGDKHRADNG